MAEEVKNNIKKSVANLFGAFGYLALSMQWLWAVALNFSLVKSLTLFVSPGANDQVVKPAVTAVAMVDSGSNVLLIFFGIIFVIIMVALTIFILIKMPSTIVNAGKKAVHGAAENVTPLVLRAQHKKDNKQNHKKLSARLVIILKIALVIIPLILSYTSKFTDSQMFDFDIAMIVAIWLTGSSIIFFVAQYLLAKLFEVKKQDIL